MLSQNEVNERLNALESDMKLLVAENTRLIRERVSAYVELDAWISLLAKLALAKGHGVGIIQPATVVIELESGQVSWEFGLEEAHLFEALPPYTKPLEAIDTTENYRRIMNPAF